MNVRDGVVRRGDSEIRADGLFSLGYPRQDRGEEINARVRVARRDLDSLRHAFGIDVYPVSGLLSGEFHLTGEYERPIGFGAMTIDDGVGYGEPFQRATSSLRFDGLGVRLDNLALAKGTGAVTGAAFVGWDSTYSFNADGRRIPVERLAFFALPNAPLSGVAEVTASGSGTFDAPRNDYRFRVNDLFVGEEGVGQVTGTLALRGSELSGEIDAASPRLALTGTGRIALTPQYRLRAHVPVPRHLARSVRAAVRAAALSVHHRRRQRGGPRRRRAGGSGSSARRRDRRLARDAAARLCGEERRADPHRARSAAGEDRGDAPRRRRHPSSRLGEHRV